MSLNDLHLKHNTFIDKSLKGTEQVLSDVAFFARFENKDEALKKFFTVTKKRRGELETNQNNDTIFY